MTRLLVLLGAVLIAGVAQRWLLDGEATRDSLVLFIIAAILFAAFSYRPPSWPTLPLRRVWLRRGQILAGIGLLFAILAGIRFTSGNYGGLGFFVWIAAMVLYVAGVWSDGESQDPDSEESARWGWTGKNDLSRRWTILILILIILAAAAMRYYALDIYPNGCQSDECNNGLDALNWLAGADYVPYAETNEGQATLFSYLLAAAIALFGQSVHTMRMVSAAIGVLTVLGFYFLARELYQQRIALLTTALLAADRWHITFSRIVYELILVPLVLILQVLFLLKAIKTGRRRWWGLSGMLMALGLNTYTAYRVVPVFVGVYFAYWLVVHRQRVRQDLEGILVFLGGALVAIVPLGVYVLTNWSIFFSRMNNISVFRDVEIAGSREPIWSNLQKTLLMFNVRGDGAALNNLPGAPLLHALVGVLLILGIAWAIRWIWREVPFLYLSWFVIIASVAVLSVAHEAPTARRPIGLIPLLYLLAAAVMAQLRQAWADGWGERRLRPLFVALSALTIFVMLSNAYTYFRVQALDPSVWGAYSPHESAAGAFLAAQPQDSQIYATPQFAYHSAVRFIGGDQDIVPLNLSQHIPLRQDPGADTIFILEPVEDSVIPLLQQLYPDGDYVVHRDRYGRTLFYSYTIPQTSFEAAQGLQAAYIPGTDPSGQPVRGEQVDRIDFDFTSEPPLDPPFAARYEGALLAPQYGEYEFILTAEGGKGILYLDDVEVLRSDDETRTLRRTLAGGFQGIRVEYASTEQSGILRLSWLTPDADMLQIIPSTAYYSLPGASNGLIGYYHADTEWSDPPSLIQRDLFILPNNAIPEPFSIRWVGQLAAPVDGRYIFGTRSDDGSLVFINGELVVDNSGLHGAEYREGAIDLSAGFHDIEVLYNQYGSSREMQLWWSPPGGPKTLLPSTYLYPVEEDLPPGLQLPPLPGYVPPGFEAELEDGFIQVPEEAYNRQDRDTIDTITPSQLAPLWTFGVCGSATEQLLRPTGVAVDDEGVVYVADTGNHRIVRLSPAGKFEIAWGEEGEETGLFNEVFDLEITPEGDVAALDAVNQSITLWSPEGDLLTEYGSDLFLYRPRGLGQTPYGDYVIADTGGTRILQTSAEGAEITQFGGIDQELGAGQPTDVAAGDNGFIYVVEPITQLIWRVELVSAQAERFPGPGGNTIEGPHIAVSADGRVVITDPDRSSVRVYSADIRPLAQFGSRGSEPGQLNRPVGIALGKDGRVFITDPDLCRVTAFAGLP